MSTSRQNCKCLSNDCRQKLTGPYGKIRCCSQIIDGDYSKCPNKANVSCCAHDDTKPWVCKVCVADLLKEMKGNIDDEMISTEHERPDPKLVCGCSLGDGCQFDAKRMDISESQHPCANVKENSCPFKICGLCINDEEDSSHRVECRFCILKCNEDNDHNNIDNNNDNGIVNCNYGDEVEDVDVVEDEEEDEDIQSRESQAADRSKYDSENLSQSIQFKSTRNTNSSFKTPVAKNPSSKEGEGDDDINDSHVDNEGGKVKIDEEFRLHSASCPRCHVSFTVLTGYTRNADGSLILDEICMKCKKDPNNLKENLKAVSSNSLNSNLPVAPVVKKTRVLPLEDPRRDKFLSPLENIGKLSNENNVAMNFFGSYSNQKPLMSDGIYPSTHRELLSSVNAQQNSYYICHGIFSKKKERDYLCPMRAAGGAIILALYITHQKKTYPIMYNPINTETSKSSNELTTFNLLEEQNFSPSCLTELCGHLDEYLKHLLPPEVDHQQGTRDFFAII
jgi:hypothetical protein